MLLDTVSSDTPVIPADHPQAAFSEVLAPVDLPRTEALIAGWRRWLAGEVAGRQLSAGTADLYQREIGSWVQFLAERARTDQPTPITCEEFRVALLDRGLSTASVAGHLAAVGSLYRWAETHVPGERNIRGQVRIRQHRREAPLPAKPWEEVRGRLAEIPTNTLIGLRDRALLALLLTTGVRLISVERARVQDVNFSGVDGATWRHQAKGRTERTSEAALPDWARDHLLAYLENRRVEFGLADDAPLFVAHDRTARPDRPLLAESMRLTVVDWFLRWGYLKREERSVDVITLRSGKTRTGTIASENDQEVVLVRRVGASSPGVVTSIPRSDIVKQTTAARWYLTAPRQLSAHSIRRSAVEFVADQEGLEAAQEFAGHADIMTTKRAYAGVKKGRMQRKIAGLMEK